MVSNPGRVKEIFSFSPNCHIGSQLAPYLIGAGFIFWG
jgi:hypothetical protein